MKGFAVGAIAIVVVAIVAVIFLMHYTQFGAVSTGNVILSLTDPANVPSGTQNLSITYSAISVHTIGSNTSGWTNLSASGGVDLLSLSNSSIVLASTSIPNGTKINMLAFNVSNAQITINNTVYKVILPSNRIIAHINSTQSINGTVKVLLDLSPTVVTIVTANSTVFIMVPSIRAVIIPNPSKIIRTPGAKASLDLRDKAELEDITPNISISAVHLATANNITNLQVTVKDNSNTSVLIRHVQLFGNQSVVLPKFNYTIGDGNFSETQHSNITPSDLSATVNGTTRVFNSTERESELINIGRDFAEMKTITFFAGSNGTLYLPYLQCMVHPVVGGENEGPTPVSSVCPAYVNYSNFLQGYSLNAGQSETFLFNGLLVMGQGNHPIYIVP